MTMMSTTTTTFDADDDVLDNDDNALKNNKLSNHKQVALRVIGYNSIAVRPDEYDSRHNGIDFEHQHLRTLPVISADNINNICPNFTCSNIRTSPDQHIRILP